MDRKFGVEIECNSFDNRDFLLNPLSFGEQPKGINEVAALIGELGFDVEVQGWQHNHNNSSWICKPDASCGIEICSPVLSRENSHSLSLVLEKLNEDHRVKQDERCSLHVHVDVSDLIPNFNFATAEKLASVLAWWIKFEHVFIDFATPSRKTNRYCRCIGLTELFDHDEDFNSLRIINKLSDKYLSLNTYHLANRRRLTIEFRIAEGRIDSDFIFKWIDLILLFVDRSVSRGPPSDYTWMNPDSIFEFLKIENEDLKNWFLSRLIINSNSGKIGFFSKASRDHAFLEYSKFKE